MMPSREVTPSSVVIAEPKYMDPAAPDCGPINTLPDGCLTNILSRVDLDSLPLRRTDSTVHHTIHCALVCKHWASLVDDAVTHLHFAYEPTWDEDRESFFIHPSLGPSLKRFPFLRSLRFRNLYPEDPSSVLSALHSGVCPLLETFEYCPPYLGYGDDLPDPRYLNGAAFGAALCHCPLLRELILRVERVFNCDALNLALRKLPNLESFDVGHVGDSIYGFRMGEQDVLLRVHEGLTKLKSLSLRHEAKTIIYLPVDTFPLLERLLLENCFYVDLPSSFGNLGNLRSLRLAGLPRLESITPSIGRLHRLTRLEIISCPSLLSLPESLGDLSSSLLRLRIDFCRSLRSLPESFGRLSSLEKVTINQSLDSLPESVGALGALRKMKLDCGKMAGLPEALGSLRSLTSLYLYGKGPRKLPESLGLLTSLRCLDVNVPSLRQLPLSVGQLGALTLLKIGPPREGRELPLPEALGDLRALKSLTLCSCWELPESLGRLEALEMLALVHCRLSRLPESIGKLWRLQELSLLRWEELPLLPECLVSMPSLRSVVITTVQTAKEGHPSLAILDRLKRQGVFLNQSPHYKWFDNP